MGAGVPLPAVVLQRWKRISFVIDGWHRVRVAGELGLPVAPYFTSEHRERNEGVSEFQGVPIRHLIRGRGTQAPPGSCVCADWHDDRLT
jgi:hypothetical protein